MSARRLIKNAGFSVAQVMLSATALFLLYRVLMRHLSIAEIGLWALVTGSTSLARLSDFGLGGGVVRFVALDLGRGDRRMAAKTVGMAFVAVTTIVAAASLVLYPLVLPQLVKAVPGSLANEARALLPLAFVALVIGSASNVFMSALDGFQRMDLRASVQLLGSVVQVAAAAYLLPRFGLVSLGYVQIIQATVVLVIYGVTMALQLGESFPALFGWSRLRFRELLKYGGGIQIAAVGQLLFEPSVKAILAVFGGLALTGYYEMANRMILQFRAVIVSAFNVMVPYVTGRIGGGEMDDVKVRDTYRESYRLLLFVSIPYYTTIGVLLPSIILLWSGKMDRNFILVSAILMLGWAANTMAGPAYFLYLAIGRLRWTILSQTVIGALNIVFAWAAGSAFGGGGVLWGSVGALALGSFVTIIAFHRDFKIPLAELLPTQSVAELAVSSIPLASVLWLALSGPTHFVPSASLILLLLYVPIMLFIIWRNPLTSQLASRILQG